MSVDRWVELRGVRVPTLFYGTAWKEERTAPLVRMALGGGVHGIDTANQRRHYHEAGVGEALREALEKGLSRADLFLQSKFTHRDGQDHRLPYDPAAPIRVQVEQSLESSLTHLGVTSLDSYLLHGPSLAVGLAEEDWEAWRAMESQACAGRTRLLGVSNVSAAQLELLLREAAVKPAMVQNRCYASRGWDRSVRAVCAREGMRYQGFSLLTANRQVLSHPALRSIAAGLGRTVPQVIFRFALELGMVVLTGTTDPQHLAQDLAAYDFRLAEQEVTTIEALAG